MATIDDKRQEILNAIFDNPNAAFANEPFAPFELMRYKGQQQYVSANHLNGRRSATGRGTYIADGQHDKHAMFADESGGSVEILKYWEQTHDEKFPNCPDLFAIYGVEPLPRDEQQAKREQERKTATNTLVENIRKDYLGKAGENVRNYLTKPIAEGGRGWKPEVVEAMGQYVGVITDTTAKQLAEFVNVPKDAPTRFPLIIYSVNKGVIEYVKLRTIDPNAPKADKWRNPTNTGDKGRDDVELFNWSNVSFLTGCRTLTIVESEICAAHATVVGIPNVVALRGSDTLKADRINKIVARGCENVVLFFDDDEKGRKATRETIKQIQRHTDRLTIKVAEMGYGLHAKDPDELLSMYDDGAEMMKDILANASVAYMWAAHKAAVEYRNATTAEERDNAEYSIIRQAEELREIGEHRAADKLIKEFCEQADTTITPESMAAEVADTTRKKATERYEKQKKQALERLNAATDDKEFRAAVAELADLRQPKDNPEINAGKSMKEAFAEMYRDVSLDIKTNYKLYNGKRPMWLKLYADGITYFAAGTGHGKSTMLQNIAFDLLRQGKRVLFYGFEETKRNTLMEFVNIYVHAKTKNEFGDLADDGSKAALNDYFGNENAEVFDRLTTNQQQKVADGVKNFFHDYRGIDGGEQTLFVYDDGLTSTELLEHAKEQAAIVRADAVFVDYVQFLVSDPDNPKAQMWEDLGKVSKDLISLNKALGIPVVVAAQINERNAGAQNPDTLSKHQIFGASTLAQGAASIVLIYNTKEGQANTFAQYFGEQLPLATEGYIILKMDKNRFGASPAIGAYKYNGGCRWVDPDTLKQPEQWEQPKQETKQQPTKRTIGGSKTPIED